MKAGLSHRARVEGRRKTRAGFAGRFPALFALALVLAALEGCAAMMPATPTSSSPAGGGGAPGGAAAANSHAPVDSLPSADAQRVLASIPEPIPPAERVAPGAVIAAGAAADSAHADSSDSQHAAVPVPEPTATLGDRPGNAELAAASGGAAVAGDTLGASGAPAAGANAAASGGAGAAPSGSTAGAAGAAAGAASGGAAKAAGTSVPGSTGAASGPCYRLQVAAPSERTQAERMKSAAESQLELPFTITQVKSIYKVRTRDCLSEDAVTHLRARARASGFSGAFTVAEGAK